MCNQFRNTNLCKSNKYSIIGVSSRIAHALSKRVPCPLRMSSNEARGTDYIAQAEAKLKSASGFFGRMFGCVNEFEKKGGPLDSFDL